MQNEAEYEYMRESGLPVLMEALLAKLVDTRSSDPMALVADHALGIRAQALVDANKGSWPTGGGPVTDGEKRSVETFSFDVFDIGDPHADQLLVLLEYMFESAGALAALGCSKGTFRTWLLAVRAQYNRDVRFHNFRHAFAVTQQAYVFLCCCDGLKERLSGLEVAALLFCALCHDMGHPGLNNTYQRNAGTKLSVRYNDQSPLENLHCCLAFETVACSDCNILGALQTGARATFRKNCIAIIMATDVSAHSVYIRKLKEIVAARQVEGGGMWTGMQLIDWDNDEHRLVLMQNLMMMADISNETRSFELSQKWAPLVAEEFCLQGDREKQEGLTVLPMMDREKAVVATEQQGFIQYLCLPLYESAVVVLPQLECCVEALRRNAQNWKEREGSAS